VWGDSLPLLGPAAAAAKRLVEGLDEVLARLHDGVSARQQEMSAT
jgi:hypothetical protein